MDTVRFGRGVRALRIRRRWRQQDLADASGVSRGVVQRVESGRFDSVPVGKVDRIARSLGAATDLRLGWNGEALDRLLDAAHAALVELVAATLRAAGWEVVLEATFQIYGERGSVDILGWHAGSRVVLVIEIKSVVPDIQAMLASLDRKARLAPAISRDRGWAPATVGQLLVIGDTRTARRRIEALSTTFSSEFPDRAVAVRRWLAKPVADAPLRGLWFLSAAHQVRARHRVPRP